MYWNKKYFLHNKQEESIEDAADSRKTSLGTYTRRGVLESHYESGCRVGGHQIPSEKQEKIFHSFSHRMHRNIRVFILLFFSSKLYISFYDIVFVLENFLQRTVKIIAYAKSR
jgi:hypothetical protein